MRSLNTRWTVTALLVMLAACEGVDSSGEASRTLANADDDSAASPGAPPSVDAGCAIVTEAELEETLGFAVLMNDDATGTCVVTAEGGSPSSPALDIRQEARTDAFAYFSAQPDATPIEGLGDRAVWATLNEMTGNLVVVRGDSALTVAIARADGLEPEDRRVAERVARLVVDRQ